MRMQWNQVGLNNGHEAMAIAGFFCPNCGSEIYSKWSYNCLAEWDAASEHDLSEYKKMQTESQQFTFLKVCPMCQGNLQHTEGYFHQLSLNLLSREVFFTTPIRIYSNSTEVKRASRGIGDWDVYWNSMVQLFETLGGIHNMLLEEKDPIGKKNIKSHLTNAYSGQISKEKQGFVLGEALKDPLIRTVVWQNENSVCIYFVNSI